MKVENNITVFSGDTRNNTQAGWVNREAAESSDKKSRTIYAGSFLKEFQKRKEREDEMEELMEDMPLEKMADLKNVQTEIQQEIQNIVSKADLAAAEIKNMVSKMNLMAEDLKGAKVDANI